ncbi:MAG: FkbM family methyltransferase [Rhodobacteraceae bacterium]|nr:FkbM family methyltransferase [Paracoccaceae bacterium]
MTGQRSLQHIRAFGLKTYIAKKVFGISPAIYHKVFRPQTSEFIQTAYGVDLAANWDDGTFQLCVFGQHGRKLADLLASQTAPFVFLDIGANQGLFTLLATRNPACVHCIAFEPVTDTFELLKRNATHSPNADRITCIQAAVSSEAGTAQITINEGHSGSASLASQKGKSFEIKTVSSTEIEALLPKEANLFVKIDVEGFEGTVIPEVLKLPSASRISHLFSEIDRRWVDFDTISSALADAGLTKQETENTQHFDLLAERG